MRRSDMNDMAHMGQGHRTYQNLGVDQKRRMDQKYDMDQNCEPTGSITP
jgi:hypothetical protein